MYRAFFNLREDPFGLNPDPHFLFPSERHRDAFRYLLYGIKNREGFIEVIGDVGTGKTLLCRSLLTLLGQDVKSDLVLNPPYSDVEFFEYVMMDLGIQEHVGNRRDALENLNEFLLREYQAGRNVIIVIDEAQHLTNEMLEQVRLLSNLETEKRKLIQIILVGQPELEEKLRNPNMKQLDQRITLRYYLEPLKKKEVKEYIYHRLRVAGSSGDIKFKGGALKKIYKFSKGVPRLVNIACDKALLTAYFYKTHSITAKHVTIALRSTQRRWKKYPRLSAVKLSRVAYSIALLVIIYLLIANGQNYKDIFVGTENAVLSLIKPGDQHPSDDDEVVEYLQPSPEENANNSTFPVKRKPDVSIAKATGHDVLSYDKYDALSLANLLDIWGKNTPKKVNGWERGIDGKLKYEKIARKYGLSSIKLTANLHELSVINMPCVLFEVTDPELDEKLPLVLTGLSEDEALVIHPEKGKLRYTKNDLAFLWTGEAIVLWNNIDKLSPNLISPWRGEKGIEKVEQRLHQLGYFKERFFDDMEKRKQQRARALMNFQLDHQLNPDGVVGIHTRLVLYNIVDQPFTPTLKRETF